MILSFPAHYWYIYAIGEKLSGTCNTEFITHYTPHHAC